MMTVNTGNFDRVLRILLGVALIVSALTGYFAPWGWVGVIPLLTALVGWCPGYAIFGFNSCPLSKGE